MPTIVAVKKDNQFCIGSDSLSIVAGSRKLSSDFMSHSDRILSFQGNYIGINGAPVISQALKRFFRKTRARLELNTVDNIFEVLLKIHESLRQNDFIINSTSDDPFESSLFELLIINPHGIFKTYELRSVQQFSTFYAIGSGAAYALGAVEALYKRSDLTVTGLVQQALDVASVFDDATGGPYNIYPLQVHPT